MQILVLEGGGHALDFGAAEPEGTGVGTPLGNRLTDFAVLARLHYRPPALPVAGQHSQVDAVAAHPVANLLGRAPFEGLDFDGHAGVRIFGLDRGEVPSGLRALNLPVERVGRRRVRALMRRLERVYDRQLRAEGSRQGDAVRNDPISEERAIDADAHVTDRLRPPSEMSWFRPSTDSLVIASPRPPVLPYGPE